MTGLGVVRAARPVVVGEPAVELDDETEGVTVVVEAHDARRQGAERRAARQPHTVAALGLRSPRRGMTAGIARPATPRVSESP